MPDLPNSFIVSAVFSAPAGIIMSLTGQSMAPERRAFGMGVFLSFYFLIMTAAPPLAGWLFDRTGRPYTAIVFAAGLFAAAGLGFAAFGPTKRWLAHRELGAGIEPRPS